MSDQWACDWCGAAYPSPKAAMLCCDDEET